MESVKEYKDFVFRGESPNPHLVKVNQEIVKYNKETEPKIDKLDPRIQETAKELLKDLSGELRSRAWDYEQRKNLTREQKSKIQEGFTYRMFKFYQFTRIYGQDYTCPKEFERGWENWNSKINN